SAAPTLDAADQRRGTRRCDPANLRSLQPGELENISTSCLARCRGRLSKSRTQAAGGNLVPHLYEAETMSQTTFDFDRREHLERVASRIGAAVLEFCQAH